MILQNDTADYLLWLNESVFVATGTVEPLPDSNFYEPFLAIYDTSGFQNVGITDVQGRLNHINAAVVDGSFFYTTGLSQKEIVQDTHRQFLCKYAIEDFVSVNSPIETKQSTIEISISPNPFWEYIDLNIEFLGQESKGLVQIYDSKGVL